MTTPIVAVTLNAALDVTYMLPDEFQIGGVHRASWVISRAGGKGNNVSRVIQRLGGNVIATGFVGGRNGTKILDGLASEGIRAEFHEVINQESRSCLALIHEDGRITEILEPGLFVRAEDVQSLGAMLRRFVRNGAFVVFSGSLPAGCSVESFQWITELAREAGGRIVIDTSGATLTSAVQWNPFMIKPNAQELETLMMDGMDSRACALNTEQEGLLERIRPLLVQLRQSNVQIPLVTLGKEGAVALAGETLYRAFSPKIPLKNAVGSGDSFIGAFLWALQEGLSVLEALRIATAAGAVNATKLTAGDITKEEVLSLAERVKIEERS